MVFHRSNPKSESNSFFHFFSIVRRRFGVVLFRSTVASSGSSGLSRRKPSASASSPSSVPTRIVYRERVPSSHSDLPFWQRNWFIALLFVMAIGFFALALFLFLGLDLDHGSPSSASAASSEGVEITYGSVLKLMHEKTKFRLHSHDVPYGSGSGQQSVTGFPNVDDSNSYWIVRPQPGTSAKQGDTIKSGTIIRLQHMRTRKWLHSHLHASPISGNLEHPFVFARWFDVSLVFSIMLVACVDFMMTEFIKKAQHCHNLTALTGQISLNGVNCRPLFDLFWQLTCLICTPRCMITGFEDFSLVLEITICENSGLCNGNGMPHIVNKPSPIVEERVMNPVMLVALVGIPTPTLLYRLMIEGSGKTWKQEQRVRLQHIDTGGYLHSHDKKYSRIAGGQQEVCGVREKRADNVWLAAEGVYLPVTETK
ncbi:stromal cell-derived factor 2-like protein [Cucumis melo var. makuwa]|uniref:Stromal cell-derived factor 2-like protein n=1 Tax=Cucumis melo var. makuwa TaxID=1194695 RepID=A0A5D3D8V4_CUCMM|nr:stromal cell-derived factor 2-like protein [Cucumis melo var. makuwa]